MLLFISIILSIIVLIISTYFIYCRIMSSKEKSSDNKPSQHKKTFDVSCAPTKKNKNKKKGSKISSPESGSKASNDEQRETIDRPKVIISPNETNPDESSMPESVEVAEPLLQASAESGCYSMMPEVENNPIKDESQGDFGQEIKRCETEIHKLTDQLEEATKTSTFYKDRAETLDEENKNIKVQITKLEQSKAKIEEQLKKVDKSNSDSVSKNVDLEKRLTLKHTELVDLKQNFELVSNNLLKSEMKIKSDHEKMKQLQEEKDCALKKIEEIAAKSKTDDISHLKMYKEYDKKILQLNAHIRQLEIDKENLNEALTNNSEKNKELINELKEIKSSSNRILEEKCNLTERLNEMSQELEDKLSRISHMDTERSQFLENIDKLKREFRNKSEEAESKLLQISEEKNKSDLFITELQLEKSTLQSHIDQLNKEILSNSEEVERKVVEISSLLNLKSSNLENLKEDNQILSEENANLRKEVHRVMTEKRDEEAKLLEMSSHLKEKNKDFMILQDQKSDLLNIIDQLKKEISSKPDVVKESPIEIESTLKEKDNIIRDLIDEKLVVQKEFEDLKKQIIYNDQRHLELENTLKKMSKELEEKNRVLSEQNNYVNDTCQMEKVYQQFQTASAVSDNSEVVEEMQSHIDKLRDEILSLQGKYFELKNGSPTLDQQLHRKNIEVNALKQCLCGIDGSLLSIGDLALELQKTFSDTSTERNRLKTEHDELRRNYDLISAKYESLSKEVAVVGKRSLSANTDATDLLASQLTKCQEENHQLKGQLDQYRVTLEKTESCLQNIQASVDQEENNWKVCLKSSEQEQQRLEEQIKQLQYQIEELRTKKGSDSSAMISMETPPIVNGSLSSETKKKKKRKNKKKKNKNHVSQS